MCDTGILDPVSPDTTFINCCSSKGVSNNNISNNNISSSSRNAYNQHGYRNGNLLNEYCSAASTCGKTETNDFDEYLAGNALDELSYIDFDILQDSVGVIDKNYQQELFSDTSSRSSRNSIGDNFINIRSDPLKSSRRATNSTGISSLPASSAYSGEYGFEVNVEKQSKDSKAGLYTFSEVDRKLYTRPFVKCPVVYRTRGRLPSGCVLRILPVYVRPEHVQEVVRRCPNHQLAREPEEDLKGSVEHLMLAEDEGAMYKTDHESGRLSILLAHDCTSSIPAEARTNQWFQSTLKFMCYSSCVGGLNRRPLQLIFTLEHGGCVLGRQSIEVRICACPGRDRRGAEKQRASFELTPPCSVKSEAKCPTKASRRRFSGFDEGMISRKEIKLEKTDSECNVNNIVSNTDNNSDNIGSKNNDNVFILSVRGRKSFELLVQLRDCLELVQFLPRHQLQYYSSIQQNMQSQICSK